MFVPFFLDPVIVRFDQGCYKLMERVADIQGVHSHVGKGRVGENQGVFGDRYPLEFLKRNTSKWFH